MIVPRGQTGRTDLRRILMGRPWLTGVAVAGLLGATACTGDTDASEATADAPSAVSEAPPEPEAWDPEALWRDIRADIDLYYAYSDRRDVADPDAYFDKLGERLVETESVEDFRRELHRATYAFADPHFIVGPFEESDLNIFPTSSDLVIRGDDFAVVDVRADSPAATADVRPGWRLQSVGGQLVNDGVAEVLRDLAVEPTSLQCDYAATLLANGRASETRELEFRKPDGETVGLELPSPRDFASEVSDRDALVLDAPAPGIARLRVNNRLGDMDVVAKADVLFAELGPVEGFILDLRNTPSGGNTTVAQTIMGHFVREPAAYQIHDYPSMEREFGVPRRSVEYVLPREPFVDAPLVVLGGHWTGSMGEGMVIGLDAAADAYTISSDMGDLLGGLSNFSYLDGAVKVDMGTYTLSHMDGTPREHYVADEELPSADMDADGGDPALRAALSYLSSL